MTNSTSLYQTSRSEEAPKGVVGGGIIGGLAGLLTAAGFGAIPGPAPLPAGGSLISLLGATGASMWQRADSAPSPVASSER